MKINLPQFLTYIKIFLPRYRHYKWFRILCLESFKHKDPGPTQWKENSHRFLDKILIGQKSFLQKVLLDSWVVICGLTNDGLNQCFTNFSAWENQLETSLKQTAGPHLQRFSFLRSGSDLENVLSNKQASDADATGPQNIPGEARVSRTLSCIESELLF